MPIEQRTQKAKTHQLKLLLKDTKLILKKSKCDTIQLMKHSTNLQAYFPALPPPDNHPTELSSPEPDP